VSAAAAAAPTEQGRRIALVFSGLMLVMFMAALDGTIVSTALPTIAGDLGGLDKISWVVTAYLLAQTAVCPLYGKLGDQLGRKRVLQAALVIFLAGSALSGQSQSMTELIIFRALQGLGGGGLMVGAQAAIADVVSPRERGRYVGAFGAAFGVATVLGPVLGGALTAIDWRWIFYVNLPVGVVALVVLQATLPGAGERTQHRIDYLGTALLAGSLSFLIVLTTLGGSTYAWGSPEIVGFGVLSAVLLVGFIVVEQRVAEPVIPPALWRNRVFSVTGGIGLVVGLALFGGTTYIPLFLQVVNGATPTESGLQLLPMMLGLLLTSIGSGQVITRTGRYKPYPIVGCAVMAGGLLLLSTMDASTSGTEASLFMFVFGLGIGLVMQVLVLAVQNAVEYDQLGVATSGSTLFRLIGGSLGTALLGSIFTNGLDDRLAARLPVSGEVKELETSGVDPSAVADLPPDIQNAYVDAFAGSLDRVFVVAACLAFAAFVLAWFLEERPLRDTVGTAGVGEALAMPKQHDSLSEIERGLWALMGRDAKRRVIERIAARAGVDMQPLECWLLARVGEKEHIDLGLLASRHDIDRARLEDALAELERRGLVAPGEGGAHALTDSGRETLERLYTARREGLEEMLEGWSHEQHDDLAELLDRLSRSLAPEVPAT
jgi:EmrB/QacA subfamily drug resistance transporter